MCDAESLNVSERREILSDFTTWSGGYLPDECEPQQLRTYASTSRDPKFTEAAVLDYLMRYGGMIPDHPI